MAAPEREQRHPISLGNDPDLIARYLAGEEVTELLREMEAGGPESPERRLNDEPSNFGTHAGESSRSQQAPTTEKPAERPTLALIALGIALAMFAISIWIALR